MIRNVIRTHNNFNLKNLYQYKSFSTSIKKTRNYTYIVDVHGQLFLSDTKVKNFTSCYKEPAFLDFFYHRIKRNDDETNEEDMNFRSLGYEFVSPCGIERNYIKFDASVLVFQSITLKGLNYAGSSSIPFDPSSLRIDSQTGYLYHPSPLPNLRRQNKGQLTSSFGPYSLMRSSLVLDRISDTLEMENDESGSFEWEGKRWKIGKLEEGMVWRSKNE